MYGAYGYLALHEHFSALRYSPYVGSSYLLSSKAVMSGAYLHVVRHEFSPALRGSHLLMEPPPQGDLFELEQLAFEAGVRTSHSALDLEEVKCVRVGKVEPRH